MESVEAIAAQRVPRAKYKRHAGPTPVVNCQRRLRCPLERAAYRVMEERYRPRIEYGCPFWFLRHLLICIHRDATRMIENAYELYQVQNKSCYQASPP